MTKARDLADLIAAGNPLADGAISVAEISDLTASAAELNQLDNTADLPDIRPSLLLDFANSKTLDPRITFTRGSTATYYDGVTTAKAEENLVTYSQEIDQWGKSANITVTANSTTAPDGTTTADTVAGNTATSGTRWVSVGASHTGNATYSFYAKAGTNNYVQAYFNTGGVFANFDLSTGAVGSSSGVTASIVDVGSGWYRCIISDLIDTYYAIFIQLVDSSTAGRAAASTLQTNIYLWGAQKEIRSSVTAYTPTTSSPIVKYQPVLQTAASGEARFDHDPVTGESKGLLIEEARTNLILNSVAFDNVSWIKSEISVTPNLVVAPDGTLTASKLTPGTTVNTFHSFFQNLTLSDNTIYTASIFLKKGERYKCRISIKNKNGDYPGALIDLSNGTLTELVGPESTSITDVGNGWYHCTVSVDMLTGASTPQFILWVYDDSGNIQYTGDGYSGIYVWGGQVEAGSFPTSYIPTSGSTVTRAKDDAKVTGSNFTDWYANTPISVYCDYSIDFSQPNSRLLSLDDGSFNNRMLIGIGTSAQYGPFLENVVDNVGNVFQGASGITPTPAGSHKIAAALDFNDAAVTRNGGTLGVDSSCWVSPNIDQLVIGAQSSGTNTISGTIKKLAFYPKRLPNATLQAMTEE